MSSVHEQYRRRACLQPELARDHAASRVHLFAGFAMFAKKVVLTRRIRWFENSTGSPSFNHCWMILDREHHGPPTLAYAWTRAARPIS
jgi:hypothetical protein